MPPVTQSVIEAVAAREGVEPAVLVPRLGEVVDADALNDLFASGRGDAVPEQVTFRYRKYRVTVTGNREVSVAPLE